MRPERPHETENASPEHCQHFPFTNLRASDCFVGSLLSKISDQDNSARKESGEALNIHATRLHGPKSRTWKRTKNH